VGITVGSREVTWRKGLWQYSSSNNNNNNNILSSSLSLVSPLCKVFTIIYLKQTMFLGYIVLQQFCTYNLCYV